MYPAIHVPLFDPHYLSAFKIRALIKHMLTYVYTICRCTIYTHLIRLPHRLIFSAGRKFHCPFSHKVFAATFLSLPSPTHRSSPGNWVTFVANPLSSRAAQLFPLTFFFYFISFFGFSTYPTDISKFALQIIFIFISRLFLHIFPKFFFIAFSSFF